MSWPGQATEHDADHGEADEGCGGSCMALEVACQSTVSADPGQGAFDERLYNVAGKYPFRSVFRGQLDYQVGEPGR